jgi:eukaryotic-like serine/threonine-protein kinase
MALALGTRLGPYEIVAPLGAGGMGEVYRARDTRLERAVAIKILREQLSHDPVRRQRFEREAKTVSHLSHPHICVLHDVGHQDGIDYLVMECVEGETLARRLEKGSLPLEQALKLGAQIADALDKAHRSGVVHRDLKPGNIMLTPSGAKLLDFGLAKAVAPLTSLATLTAAKHEAPVTEQGTIVGTFQYMSPEQIEGKELDGRSDIFSLGAVLYEMVTGKRAFEGKNQLSVASAILEREPAPISVTKPLTPPSLEHVIRRCLAKDPEHRWQTARDVSLELNSVTQSEPVLQPHIGAVRARARNFREWLAWGLTAILLLAATHFFVRSRSTEGRSQQLFRTSILAPEQTRIPWASDAAVSPDGRLLVFSASTPDGEKSLWLRPVDSLSARPLPGTNGGYNPFWSPDSRWIAFISFSDSKLKKISIEGGSALDICTVSVGRGGAWGPDGTILFAIGSHLPLYSVPATGGTPVPVTQLDKSLQEEAHRWPVFLPDGKHFLFFAFGGEPGGPQNATYVSSLGTTERKLILKNDSNAIYAPPGYLLFVRNRSLMAQPFDTKRLELTGSALPIAEDVPMDAFAQRSLFSASANGVLSIQPKIGTLLQPVWKDRSGKFLEAMAEPAMYFPYNLALSPDGQKLAVVIIDSQNNIRSTWIIDVRGHQKSRLTYGSPSVLPVWSPDSNQILFTSIGQGGPRIFSVPATGVGQAELLFPSEGSDYTQSWSSDGRYIAFTRSDAKNQSLWILPTFGDKKPYRLFESSHSHLVTGAAFSPDVRWLAYQSDETGRNEVYVVPFPEANRRIPVSTGGGGEPCWSPDGKELYYLSGDHTLMSAALQLGKNGLQVSSTRPLFKTNSQTFTVSSDGKRFLVFEEAENQPPSAITLITNWTAALPK